MCNSKDTYYPFLSSFIFHDKMNVMSSAYSYLEQNITPLKLIKISLRDIINLETTPCDVYGLSDGHFIVLINRGIKISSEQLKSIIKSGHYHFFVNREDYAQLKKIQAHNLIVNTRSLSIGDPLIKGNKQLNLMSINFRYLYDEPENDEQLKIQLQAIRNFSKFLIENQTLMPSFYKSLEKQNHHYLLSQPTIASLFLIGLLKKSALFSAKEIENLFITSYFKDIGMSSIPENILNQETLTEKDKNIIVNHADSSETILKGRINLSNTYIDIIKNHHSYSLLKDDQLLLQNTIHGFESMIVSVMDIISAMTSKRPYRDPVSLYEALQKIRPLVAKQFPSEFRWIVNYFNQLFSKK